MLIGSHVGMKGKEMLLGSAEEAASNGASTFMIYTGAPQNTRRKDVSEMNIPKGQAFMAEHGLSDIVVHAPYIINLGNTVKPENFSFAIDFLKAEIDRAEALGATQMTLHPGAHVGAGADAAINHIIEGLNEVLTPDQTIQIAIETMAGKGTEVGRSFEEIAQMINGVKLNDKLSVTFDTCHTSDAGYDIKTDFESVIKHFDDVIGIDRLKVFHINDSKNIQGSHKDRHANIGFGEIGFEALNSIVHDERFATVPKILETPYVGLDKKTQQSPYKKEITMFKENVFNPNLLAELGMN
ncbi:deoxyribonuclease IV [Dellaglioa algida]|uniref:Probable endonuclease 4 n=1 Tax=Dellaglioa algida DSM 15638 TaxID=1423719 RepID=A0A0R1HM57_9LACO|nr:deoxyribonuclease IV [Dellaglioa algida]KRK46649.1 endonuclease IV [Dellaglioa algida DSM 15638]MDK1718093.1 deoxyribonuclease IV [Dellaglioa algida]MDK1727605.1 deoxyribonuclease IV [Dellaglioa algida]MDK1729138.1 deoxyribonuclease IV [Dellaglioa algida]MDK1732434.1 deoxyribonuclease IV [Dellaglioa algida]